MKPDRTAVLDAFLARAARERLVMGVLNVTPDSFSDGGRYVDLKDALAHAERMRAEGVDVIDIGGESTRPSAMPVSQEEEIQRISGVIRSISGQSDIPVSIDTYKAATARSATAAGAVIINDISGMTFDPGMAGAVADTGSGVVITYNRGEPDPSLDVCGDMFRFFEAAFERASAAGIPERRILVDPGIGFAKTPEQNLTLMTRLKDLVALGRPVLVGASRKSFLGRLLDRPVDQRLAGTLAAHLYVLQAGAAVVRVHDVAEHVDAIKVLNALEARR